MITKVKKFQLPDGAITEDPNKVNLDTINLDPQTVTLQQLIMQPEAATYTAPKVLYTPELQATIDNQLRNVYGLADDEIDTYNLKI